MNKGTRTRGRIIEESGRLFIARGIASTSMEDVARKTGCHRRTLYRHFPGKEDLLLEVAMAMIGRINDFQKSLCPRLQGSGLERFASFLRGLTGFMAENRELVRFLGEFDYLFNDRSEKDFLRERGEEFRNAAHETEALLLDLVETGLGDRSMALTHEPSLFVSSVTSMLWGAAQKAALRGELLEREYGISLLDMVNCQIDLYVAAAGFPGQGGERWKG